MRFLKQKEALTTGCIKGAGNASEGFARERKESGGISRSGKKGLIHEWGRFSSCVGSFYKPMIKKNQGR
jgi:hypothetical protein